MREARRGRRARAGRSGRRGGVPRARAARARTQAGQRIREVAEQDAQVGAGSRWAQGRSRARPIMRAAEAPARQTRWPSTGAPSHVPSSSVEPAEIACIPALRERIVAACEVVVAEHGERRVAGRGHELGRGRREPRSRAAACDEVARDRDDVGLELAPPSSRSGAAAEPGPIAGVHVGDVQDREPVEIARKAGRAGASRTRLRSASDSAPDAATPAAAAAPTASMPTLHRLV